MSVRRKMVDYIAKSKKIFIGLEDSKSTWRLCVRSDKEIIHELHMPARYESLRSYLRKNYIDCDIHVIYEAGFKGFNLYFDLVGDGYACTVTPPHTVTQAKCSRVKTDRTDARILAKNLENGDYKSCHVPDRERLADRQVVRSLNIINKALKAAKNQIRGLIYAYGIKTGITAPVWNDNHYKSLRTIEIESDTLRYLLDLHIDQVEFLLAKQSDLDKKLRGLAKKERYKNAVKIAESFPGIGRLTAIRLVLELGEDLSRFKSGGEIASFVGLGGAEHSTGNTIRKGGITKQGNGMIRTWLVESAWTARKRDPALQVFYNRIARNSGSANKAVVAVARKMIARLRSCVVNNVTYEFGVLE
jgi:transposase